MRALARRRWLVLACCFSVALSYTIFHQQAPFIKQEQSEQMTSGLGSTPPRVWDPNHRVLTPIWYMAPFLDGASFGAEAATIVMTLLQHNVSDANSMRIGLLQGRCEDQHRDSQPSHTFDTLIKLRTTRLQQPAIVVCHNMPMTFGLPKPLLAHTCEPCPAPGYQPAYTVARAVAETDRIPAAYVTSCNSLDEVWVPSEHSKQAFLKSGVMRDKLLVVPPVTNTSAFDPSRHEPLNAAPENVLPFTKVFGPQHRTPGLPFCFVSVFKWESRKGWDVLLDAYLSEFSSTDKVALYILTRPWNGVNDTRQEIIRWASERIKRQPELLPSLFVTTTRLHEDEYCQLLASCQVFVLPTRGEGWGLPLVEAMSMGLPIIATNHSGPADYIDHQVGYPLSFEEARVPDSVHEWFFRGFKWAEPDTQHLRQLMRQAVQKPDEAKAKGRAARQRIIDRYSPEAMSVRLLDEFRRIEQKLAAKQAFQETS